MWDADEGKAGGGDGSTAREEEPAKVLARSGGRRRRRMMAAAVAQALRAARGACAALGAVHARPAATLSATMRIIIYASSLSMRRHCLLALNVRNLGSEPCTHTPACACAAGGRRTRLSGF